MSSWNRLPSVFVAAIVVAYFAYFALSLAVPYLVLISALYLPYALAATVLAVGNVLLVGRARGGGVAVWLVCLTYTTISFAATMWGIVFLLAVRHFGLSLFEWSDGAILTGLSYAFIGGGMITDAIAAVVFVVGFKTGNLGRKIRPWPRLRKGPAARRSRRSRRSRGEAGEDPDA